MKHLRAKRRSSAAGERSGSAPRRCREKGAALVELAFVVPVLALFAFGIIEFGVAMNDYQSVRQGAREGARQGVVDDYASAGTGCLVSGASVADTDATRLICMTKERTGLGDDVRVRVVVEDTDTSSSSTGWADIYVTVCVTAQMDSMTGFFDPILDDRILASSIQMRAEQDLDIPVGTYSEPVFTGHTWSSLCD